MKTPCPSPQSFVIPAEAGIHTPCSVIRWQGLSGCAEPGKGPIFFGTLRLDPQRWAFPAPSVLPACEFRHQEIRLAGPGKARHSRGSGNPPSTLRQVRHFWFPVFTGLMALLLVSTAGANLLGDEDGRPPFEWDKVDPKCKKFTYNLRSKEEAPSCYNGHTGEFESNPSNNRPKLNDDPRETHKCWSIEYLNVFRDDDVCPKDQKLYKDLQEWKGDWEERKEAKEQAEKEEDRQEKCKEAHEKYLSDAKDAKEEQNKHTETFQNLQDQITKEEAGIRQAETDSAENLKKLTRQSKRTVHRLRDQLDQELKKMDNQISQMENQLRQMEGQLDEIQIERMKMLAQKQQMQHQIYKQCYDDAEDKLNKYRKSKGASNLTRHQSMSQLILASRQRIKQSYQKRFDHYLNHCLTRSPLQNSKQTHEKSFQIQMAALKNKENRLRQAIERLRTQVAQMKNQDKLQVLNRFKRDMQEQVNNFEADFNSYVHKFASAHEEKMKNIGNLKEKQARALHQRSEAVPQDTKNALLANQCAQAEQAFNLFSTMGGAGASPSSLPYRGMSSGYGAGQ